MIRQAQPGEEARLEAFLAGHAETSMFLRGNLATHGLRPTDHPHGTTCWLAETEAGAIRAVVGCNNEGFLMAQVPVPLPGLWSAVAQVLAGRSIAGMTGEDTQVRAALEGIGLADAPFTLNHTEPLYRLDLDRLEDPEAELRPVSPADEPMLVEWFAEHFIDTGFSASRLQALSDARRRAARVVHESALRLLLDNGVPVGMAAVNARAGDMVQLGSVHVLRPHRNRGLGRRVTAALLAEERARGARRAVLFANNPAAARAYEGLGFRHIGAYRIALLARPMPVRVMA
ncbi:GNAT family N-acetyltransferase [Vannielia litorea]|uniref:Acetyltransferase (GNAT) family protein n=1 Tax=Vannielia litorea TaxID=1217970 RepID=A0A1N6HDN3_9RHOB|nr:GNAT family N-acetyltransferase [Vannielia litorea]SIO17765.1 Acetyltransferase (GNAT) family protein [Vannielia litorea]